MKTEKMTQSITPESKSAFEPATELVIDDLERLKVLADPLRLRILELMTTTCTVKQVAAELEIPATKLYYHINLLEKHGLIVVVDTRIVSGIIEKQYRTAAKQIRVDNNLLSPDSVGSDESMEITVNTLFEDTKADLLKSMRDGVIEDNEEAAKHRCAMIASRRLSLTEEQAGDFYERYESLMDEFQKLSDKQKNREDVMAYKMTYLVFPSSRRRLSRDEE